MNAAIRAVTRSAIYNGLKVKGIYRGYKGLITGEIQEFKTQNVSNIIQLGGTLLKTARCQEFKTPEGRKIAYETMQKEGIDALVVIGGDGSLTGARLLAQEYDIPCIGLPGTIDNDLQYTELTIGFDTALNFACECINRIRETSDSHERASMITVMGRNCGDIAVHTALACGAEIVMIPEVNWSIQEVAEQVKWGAIKGKRSMIIVFAEGAFSSQTDDVQQIIAEHPELKDISEEHMTSSQIARIIEVLSGQETRATVLGYTQRGGSPTANDRILATRPSRRCRAWVRRRRRTSARCAKRASSSPRRT